MVLWKSWLHQNWPDAEINISFQLNYDLKPNVLASYVYSLFFKCVVLEDIF